MRRMRPIRISIHVPREGDDTLFGEEADDVVEISIHVPREGDDWLPIGRPIELRISIHVPREGDDWKPATTRPRPTTFQSTSPVRGTTESQTSAIPRRLFQSTSPVRGTTNILKIAAFDAKISIHVPREGDDGAQILALAGADDFNPRPP